MSSTSLWVWTIVWGFLGGAGGFIAMISPMCFGNDDDDVMWRAVVLTIGVWLLPLSALVCLATAWLHHHGIISWGGRPWVLWIPFVFVVLSPATIFWFFRGRP